MSHTIRIHLNDGEYLDNVIPDNTKLREIDEMIAGYYTAGIFRFKDSYEITRWIPMFSVNTFELILNYVEENE